MKSICFIIWFGCKIKRQNILSQNIRQQILPPHNKFFSASPQQTNFDSPILKFSLRYWRNFLAIFHSRDINIILVKARVKNCIFDELCTVGVKSYIFLLLIRKLNLFIMKIFYPLWGLVYTLPRQEVYYVFFIWLVSNSDLCVFGTIYFLLCSSSCF